MAKTYGELKVTPAELRAAKKMVADHDDELAYQLLLYCQQRICIKSDAIEALEFIRNNLK